MKKFLRSIALLLALTCLITGTVFSVSATENVSAADTYADANFVPGEVMVGLKEDLDVNSSYEELFPALDITDVTEIEVEVRTILVLTLEEQTRQSVFDAIDILADDPNVEYAEPNFVVSAIDLPAETNDLTADSNVRLNSASVASLNMLPDPNLGIIPNDEYANYLWGLVYTEAYRAWNVTTGSNDVTVAVLDTGITPVADLVDNVDMSRGINYINPGVAPTDDHGHGTHVAGIIGAKGNNNIGVSGVCWNVDLVPFKVLDSAGYGDTEDIALAIADAKEMSIPIINMSIQFPQTSSGLDEVIESYDGLIVMCAGNYSQDLDVETHYPAGFAEEYDHVLVVGSTSYHYGYEYASEYTNYGANSVHLFAPGGDIYSTVPYVNGYEHMSGTSMASPHVAGAAALILSEYPNATPEQISAALMFTVDPLDEVSEYCITGGRLNVRRAMEYFTNLRGNGDVNMDGEVSNSDLITLSRYIDGLVDFDADQILRADVNKDNIINDEDVSALAELIVGA